MFWSNTCLNLAALLRMLSNTQSDEEKCPQDLLKPRLHLHTITAQLQLVVLQMCCLKCGAFVFYCINLQIKICKIDFTVFSFCYKTEKQQIFTDIKQLKDEFTVATAAMSNSCRLYFSYFSIISYFDKVCEIVSLSVCSTAEQRHGSGVFWLKADLKRSIPLSLIWTEVWFRNRFK